tara:strand:+ start:676 stop:963 length:288 start_codon:yes stop_codon:yes gene_type:complete
MSSPNTVSKDKAQEKHPILLHAVYNSGGSVCPYKSSGWLFLLIVIIVVCVVVSRSGGSGKTATANSVAGGGATTVRMLAPSADEIMSELSSTISF